MVTLVLETVHFLRGGGGGAGEIGGAVTQKKGLKGGPSQKKNGGKGGLREIF